ncbi:MAG TPA: hypothetical protein VGH89_23110 [Pseudonocardia sp.]|jgi:hypothetical protein
MPESPDASDWNELDLLTVSEATERLDAEIASVQAVIANAGTRSPSLADARRRLELLERARERARRAAPVVRPGRVRSRAEVANTPGPPEWPSAL